MTIASVWVGAVVGADGVLWVNGPFDSKDAAERWFQAVKNTHGKGERNAYETAVQIGVSAPAASAIYHRGNSRNLWRLHSEHADTKEAWKKAAELRNEKVAEGDYDYVAISVSGPRKFPDELKELEKGTVIVALG